MFRVLRVEKCSSKNAFCQRCRKRVLGEPIWVVVGYQVAYPFCRDCSELLGLEEVRLSEETEVGANVVIVRKWYGKEQ